jgi:hypothetical protein
MSTRSAADDVRTGERSVMFDAVVQVELLQIERILTVVLLQHAGGNMWHESAERGAKVVRRTNLSREFGELDPSSTARNDT